MKIKYLIILSILIKSLFAEIGYSHKGYFDLGTIHRLSDGSIIKVPYRMMTYESITSYQNLNLIMSAALEFRLRNIKKLLNSEISTDIRELYLEFLVPIGDIRIGKQIVTWGSTSENNPTDNVSPYNYYYLFSIGKERKEGIFSINSNIYINDININTLLIPFHKSNILPLNDPEFAITTPLVPKDEQIKNLDKPFEYGISINIPMGIMDISTSYFSGYDKIVSFFGANVWANKAFTTITADTVLSFRKTDIFGLGFSALFNDLTIKTDIGYFITDDNINNNNSLYRNYPKGEQLIIESCEETNANLPNWAEQIDCNNEPTLKEILKLDNAAKYLQYVIEFEYSPNSEFRLISQYSKQKSIQFGQADSLTLSTETVSLDPEQLFIPGMGSPNTFISDNSLSVSIQKQFSNIGLKINFTNLFDLNRKGSIHELRTEYEIYENIKLLAAINKIYSNKTIEMNPFSGMEDFSHFRIELKYFY